jgi:hypothetical protein
MKNRVVVGAIFLSVLTTFAYGSSCADLLANYKRVPDPSIKTMKQLKRWVKRKVKDGNAKAVEECLISQAADNPNKATVAGQ